MEANTTAQDTPLVFTTAYGEASIQDLLQAYEKKKQYENNKKEWMKTEAGREYNRKKAKQYYDKHKEQILAKRSARYETDKDVLIERAKQYYALHTEECIEKNRIRREAKKEKIETISA